MTKSTDTKDSYLAAMAAFVLEQGFANSSLRPMAKAAGTSDRMLIYHFGNKDRLMDAVVARLAADFTLELDRVLADEPFPSRRELVTIVLEVVRADAVVPYIKVWQEMVALAAMGDTSHVAAGRAVVQGLVYWLAKRMPVGDPDPNAAAQAMLTFIEGVHVMDTVGRADVVEVALGAFYPAD